ncbi:MAG: FHA domain-containing protein [Anaerolineae bacterium]|nr:FHA domain-containing protein [Anaerolineae bacterium]
MPGDTRKLDQNPDENAFASQEIKAIDMGMPRPWRIGLRLLQKEQRLIFDMDGPMVVGRMEEHDNIFPDIDLGPYNADELGVSRQHLTLKLDGDRIVASDSGSRNGTLLNGERLEPNTDYLIRDGDEITLGLMRLKIELLVNPFN